MKDLEELGFEVRLLNLRDYYGKKEELETLLQEIEAFYAVGGNIFTLMKAMRLSILTNYYMYEYKAILCLDMLKEDN